jgi:hypothetical protein
MLNTYQLMHILIVSGRSAATNVFRSRPGPVQAWGEVPGRTLFLSAAHLGVLSVAISCMRPGQVPWRAWPKGLPSQSCALPLLEAYSKFPAKMIKQVCDLRQRAEGRAAAEGFE